MVLELIFKDLVVETSSYHITTLIFDGEKNQVWTVNIEIYLEALDLWEVIEEDYDVPSLPNNPTMTRIKSHKERKAKQKRSKSMLVCFCFNNHFHNNYVSQISKECLVLFKGRISLR